MLRSEELDRLRSEIVARAFEFLPWVTKTDYQEVGRGTVPLLGAGAASSEKALQSVSLFARARCWLVLVEAWAGLSRWALACD